MLTDAFKKKQKKETVDFRAQALKKRMELAKKQNGAVSSKNKFEDVENSEEDYKSKY